MAQQSAPIEVSQNNSIAVSRPVPTMALELHRQIEEAREQMMPHALATITKEEMIALTIHRTQLPASLKIILDNELEEDLGAVRDEEANRDLIAQIVEEELQTAKAGTKHSNFPSSSPTIL